MKLAQVFFFREGQVAACDAQGRQVPSQQMFAPYRILLQMEQEGVLGPDTLVSLPSEREPIRWEELRQGDRAGWFERPSDEPKEGVAP